MEKPETSYDLRDGWMAYAEFLFLSRMMQSFTSLSFSGCKLTGAFWVEGGADVSCRMRAWPFNA